MIENKMLRIFFLIMIVSLASFIVSVLLHNFLSSVFNIEEPVFFIIAVFICPFGILGGAIGTIVLGIKELFSRKPTKVKKVKKVKKKK